MDLNWMSISLTGPITTKVVWMHKKQDYWRLPKGHLKELSACLYRLSREKDMSNSQTSLPISPAQNDLLLMSVVFPWIFFLFFTCLEGFVDLKSHYISSQFKILCCLPKLKLEPLWLHKEGFGKVIIFLDAETSWCSALVVLAEEERKRREPAGRGTLPQYANVCKNFQNGS